MIALWEGRDEAAVEYVEKVRELEDRIEEPLKQAVASALHGAESADVRKAAEKLFPLPASKDSEPLPPPHAGRHARRARHRGFGCSRSRPISA